MRLCAKARDRLHAHDGRCEPPVLCAVFYARPRVRATDEIAAGHKAEDRYNARTRAAAGSIPTRLVFRG
jgi:hypothetical protein